MLLLLSAMRAFVRRFTTHTPASRTFIVPAEARSFSVPSETRRFIVTED